jgi:hypothetical protein
MVNNLLNPSTVTTLLGSLISIGIGVAGASGALHLPVDLSTALLWGGIGALLGHSPQLGMFRSSPAPDTPTVSK